MTELDFDELDKAVNTLMSDVDTSKRNPGLDDPEDKVLTLTMSDDSANGAVPEGLQESTPVADTVAPAAPAAHVAPLAMKRRGQFMDVMHPSSDMKSPFAPVSRQGVTLQPASPAVEPEQKAPEPEPEREPIPDAAPGFMMEMESTGPGTPPVVEQPAEVAVDEPAKSEWPDPIDIAQPVNAPDQDTPVDEVPVDTVEPAPDAEHEIADVADDASTTVPVVALQTEPQSSPFITDAKVEKRPLGLPATDEPQPEAIQAVSEDVADVSQNETPPLFLPDELKSDVMALESSNTGATSPEVVAPAPPPEPADTTSTTGSIQQQYAEQPNTGDQTNTPIFDTSTHVQPLESPKKKSPLKWILIIIALLVVGAVAGAAYFYYTTQ